MRDQGREAPIARSAPPPAAWPATPTSAAGSTAGRHDVRAHADTAPAAPAPWAKHRWGRSRPAAARSAASTHACCQRALPTRAGRPALAPHSARQRSTSTAPPWPIAILPNAAGWSRPQQWARPRPAASPATPTTCCCSHLQKAAQHEASGKKWQTPSLRSRLHRTRTSYSDTPATHSITHGMKCGATCTLDASGKNPLDRASREACTL